MVTNEAVQFVHDVQSTDVRILSRNFDADFFTTQLLDSVWLDANILILVCS